MQTLACLVSLTSQETGVLLLIDLHHANTKHNIPFQSVALQNDDNNSNHNNPNCGTIYDNVKQNVTE